ncbi:receptor-like protein 19 [Lactuca sativa]|uniref:receptor-like protein 19 n=1 Tax=Lactuca sativa TaxID=4236 RepID=UPI000CD9A1B6|nr:receptor-like protein 19 [Lactuca sativa]
MQNWRGLGLHLIFISIFFITTTSTCLGVGNITVVVCFEQERLALLKFKESVGDESKMLSSWVGNDCCLWERIHCNGVTGHVERLHLRGNTRYSSHDVEKKHDHFVRNNHQLVGNEVNSSLAELRHLKYLDLSGNDFGGSRIPEFIGSFKQLNYLNLSHIGFQGIIPPHIGNLSHLKVLDLNSNGELMADDMSWTFGLSSLEHLDLSYLDASGVDMGRYMIIPSLKELHLSSCGLSNANFVPFINSTTILRNIKHLDLSLNLFKGPLPGFFQNMTSLSFLDLTDFDLSLAWNFPNLLSMIPSLSELHLSGCGLDKAHLSSPHLNFSTLSNIQHLDLSRNSIEGVIPSVLTNMSSLRVLDLSLNSLNSSVPIMPNLLELDLSNNWFKKIEHLGIWRQCHLKKLSASNMAFNIEMMNSPKNKSECSQYVLEILDLSDCISGIDAEPTIPEALGILTNLRVLLLSNSGLTGTIPKSLGRLRYLEVLDLSYNMLTGPIPTFIGKLLKLDLSFNQLNGSIPESFGKLDALTEMYLEVNQLTGPIPASIGNLVSLQAFSMYSNLLNGSIPESFGKLAKLDWLDMSNNSLEGVVSEAHFANLSMLKHLDTSSNTKLTFNVSSEWLPPFQLVTLLLSSCTIINGFPQWLQNQRELETLVLFNTTITGPLPTWLRMMPIIPFLDLSYNKLSGSLTNLPDGGNVYVSEYYPRALFLEDNLFNGSIPLSLCRRTDLEYLNLSRNRLTGKILKCLENLQNLITMRFSSNRLSGVIPSTVPSNCSSLLRLNMNGNRLIGEIPREWGNLGGLQYLDVGDNQLSGNISEWIGELGTLIILRLHKNKFTGRIPLSLCNASHLRILDVASNSLTGTIPRCLGDLTAMVDGSGYRVPILNDDFDDHVIQVMKGVDLEYTTTLDMVYNLDLSSNKLVGEIPVELTALSMLVGLNLSNNHLSGGIPDTIGNMTSLFSLDLSRNRLTGMIPTSMATLNFLSHLNLSHNNLSGRIPTGSQLQTLIDPSIYAGNKDLCGPPLPKDCSNQKDPTTTSKKTYKAAEEPTEVWLFVLDIMSGFATGFWGVIGVLLLKKQWRWKIFRFAEETMDKIFNAVMVRVSRRKLGRQAT